MPGVGGGKVCVFIPHELRRVRGQHTVFKVRSGRKCQILILSRTSGFATLCCPAGLYIRGEMMQNYKKTAILPFNSVSNASKMMLIIVFVLSRCIRMVAGR